MIESLLIALVALVVLGYVLGPMRRGRSDVSEGSDEIADADADKNAKLGALIELEEERYSGKLSQEDFDRLRLQYESEAVEALKRLDSVKETADRDDDLESEIARVKSQLRCPSCGAARKPGAPCPECGAS